jgi:hypothetical protein
VRFSKLYFDFTEYHFFGDFVRFCNLAAKQMSYNVFGCMISEKSS